MKLSIIQLILAVLAAAMVVQGVLKFGKREKGQTFFKFLLSVSVWGGIFAFSVFPSSSHVITRWLGFGENLNTLIFLGFVIIFLVLTKMIRVIERIERNISEIVRKEALKDLDK